MLLKDFMNSDSATDSGSEKLFTPEYVSEHGLEDAPFSVSN